MAAGEGAGTTSCPSCNKRYPWRDELEGRKVKCKCGNVFEAALDLEAITREDDHTYDIASDHDLVDATHPLRRASPDAATPGAAPIGSIADAHPRRRSGVLSYAHARPAELEQQRAASPLKDWYLPIALLGLGLAFRGGQVALESRGGVGAAGLIGAATIGIALNVVLTLAAVGVSSKLMSIDFGPVHELILKVVATAVLGGAVGSFIISLSPKDDMQGPIVAIHAVVLLYWILFYFFFEMDLQECLMTVAIVTALQTAGFCILFKPLG